jgi:hypothetical protein
MRAPELAMLLTTMAIAYAPASAAPTVGGASGAPMCGVTAPNVAGFHAKALADSRFSAFGGDPLRETLSSEELQTIWTFVTRQHPAYPAAACHQVIDRDGAMQIEREIICEANAAACADFATELDAMEDGSGDGQ